MRLIRPNCRLQFTPEDLAFIVRVLRPRVPGQEALKLLLADEESRDLVLDDDKLLHAVLEQPGCLGISTHFYFYILVRHVFRRAGLEDRNVADYVAEMLAEFSHAESSRLRINRDQMPVDYIVDVLAALQTADDVTRFFVRAHLGNALLFLAGIFPDRIRWRTERRGAPGLGYYEGIGRACYREVSQHRLAREYDLESVYDLLAERFQDTRLALNDLQDRLVSLGDADAAVKALLSTSAQMWQ